MKTKITQTTHIAILIVSLVFLTGALSTATAGDGKRAWKQHEQTRNRVSDSDNLAPPVPIADETPINPVVNDRDRQNEKKHDQNKEQQKRRPRR